MVALAVQVIILVLLAAEVQVKMLQVLQDKLAYQAVVVVVAIPLLVERVALVQ